MVAFTTYVLYGAQQQYVPFLNMGEKPMTLQTYETFCQKGYIKMRLSICPQQQKVCESLFCTKKEGSRDVWKEENTTGGGGHCPPPDKGAVLGGASGRSRRGLVTCPWGTDSHKVFVSQAFQSVLCITECAAADYLVLQGYSEYNGFQPYCFTGTSRTNQNFRIKTC